jgi:phosphoribosylglycinamide formyltransferase-1
MAKKQLAIFASGNGSNALQIIQHFKDNELATVALVVCNNAKAGVLAKVAESRIPSVIISKNDLYNSDLPIDLLKNYKIDLIILAGFLWQIPSNLIQNFPKKIINIHPALLPKFGGKGMYGINVHKAVIAAKERDSGITIHYVNEHYDEGEHIAFYKCMLTENETAESLQKKINQLELRFFPKVIQSLL